MTGEVRIGNQRPLRCQGCGEQIGLMWGDEPDWEKVSALCYACAATKAAEAITREANEGGGMTVVAETLCDGCGHPRHLHVHCNDLYPALCTHADPVAAGERDDDVLLDSICWCLDFLVPETP